MGRKPQLNKEDPPGRQAPGSDSARCWEGRRGTQKRLLPFTVASMGMRGHHPGSLQGGGPRQAGPVTESAGDIPRAAAPGTPCLDPGHVALGRGTAEGSGQQPMVDWDSCAARCPARPGAPEGGAGLTPPGWDAH